MTEHSAACDWGTCICWSRREPCGCYLWDQDCPEYQPIEEITMNDYRKKPVTVEARQFIATSWAEQEKIAAWCHGKLRGQDLKPAERVVQIETLEGEMEARVGDYIINGVAGEFYPCKPDIFAQSYEEVGSSGDREFVLARLLTEAEKHVPEIKLPENAFADGYSVELGEHRFTQAQWEAIQLYAAGTAEIALTESEADVRATLNRMQAQVREFHEGMGQPVGTEARALPQDRVAVRVELIREEFQDELIPALEAGDLVETADACIDILYVTFGLLVEMGIDAAPLFDEVQRSNMSKFGADGKAIIAGPNDPDGVFEGRVKKGPNYFKPNLADLLFSGNADLGRQ